ncbi:hypothetical protein PsW64_03168 [Pseudovibrio sp. W64]|nr:hypothetical protein PsW64_03168 [Pseudovibrio sp. W64]
MLPGKILTIMYFDIRKIREIRTKDISSFNCFPRMHSFAALGNQALINV